MSTLTAVEIPVPDLYTGAQITYDRREWIVLDVLPIPFGGWVVIAVAVDDPSDHPVRYALVYANRPAVAELEHREVSR